jgi:hypothetical protein
VALCETRKRLLSRGWGTFFKHRAVGCLPKANTPFLTWRSAAAVRSIAMNRSLLVKRFPGVFTRERDPSLWVLQVYRAPNIGGCWNLTCGQALLFFKHQIHPVQKAGNAWSSRTQSTTIPPLPPCTTSLFEHLRRLLLLSRVKKTQPLGPSGSLNSHHRSCNL